MPDLLKGTGKKEKAILIRVSLHDYALIKKQAELYTRGVVAEWIRYSSKLEPKKEDVQCLSQ